MRWNLLPELRGSNNSAKEAQLILRFREMQLWTACLQETWKHGDDMQENGGCTFHGNGLAEKECRRGSHGLAIALSPDTRRAWERAGPKWLAFGPRILATNLLAVGPEKWPLAIVLVGAYAPDS